MKYKFIFLEEFGKAFVPKKMRTQLRSQFLRAGIIEVPYKLFGATFYLSVICTFFLYFRYVYGLFSEDLNLLKVFIYTLGTWIVLPLAFVFLFGAVIYIYLDLKIYNRTRRMETVLPSFLRFVAENLKGGMPFEKALWSAVRPEFDVLSAEVLLAAKRVMTGEDVDSALKEFTSKYKSPMLKRSFDLIIESMQSGGRVADLISRIVEDLEESSRLKQEMNATNLSYMIFIAVIVVVVAPGLFTLSFQFLNIVIGIGETLGSTGDEVSALPISFGSVSLDPDIFVLFSRWALVILSVCSAMIISQISRGDIRGGIKYIPVFLVLTQIIYSLLMVVAGKFLGGIV